MGRTSTEALARELLVTCYRAWDQYPHEERLKQMAYGHTALAILVAEAYEKAFMIWESKGMEGLYAEIKALADEYTKKSC